MKNPKEFFSKIYDQYIDKIYRFIFVKTGSQEIAEDLCSETFLRGWKAFEKSHKPSFNNKKIENLPAFLYQIARNLVADHYREKSKTQIISTESTSWQGQIIDSKTNLEEEAMLKSDIENIRLALINLKEDYQTVIIYRYLNDISMPEIAKNMDKSEQAVRVTLHRALKALKKELNLS
ncbi:RNA polymerase sigma factor [Patescibacteria group bacterium]